MEARWCYYHVTSYRRTARQRLTNVKVALIASRLTSKHCSLAHTDGAMWFEHNEELVAVRHAFYKACEELGIGSEESDKERREQLEQVFLTIFNFGEHDPDMIRARAVQQMRAPAAGLFHQ